MIAPVASLIPVPLRFSTVATSTSIASVRKSTVEELWKHTRDPIKAPLLKRLQIDRLKCDTAVTLFSLILKVF